MAHAFNFSETNPYSLSLSGVHGPFDLTFHSQTVKRRLEQRLGGENLSPFVFQFTLLNDLIPDVEFSECFVFTSLIF